MISAAPGLVLLAQAIYSEPHLSFEAVGADHFQAILDRRPNPVRFAHRPGGFLLFDASCPGPDIDGDDRIAFDLDGDVHWVLSDLVQMDAETRLILHALVRSSDGGPR